MSGFLLDMAHLFEDFLGATLTRALEARGGICRAQDSHALDAGGHVRLIPDLVWYLDGRPAVVVDAKYKAQKRAGYPNADVYQILAYCTALGLEEGHLVYAKGNESPVTHQVVNTRIRIQAHALDLSAPPRSLLAQIDGLADRFTRAAVAPSVTTCPGSQLASAR